MANRPLTHSKWLKGLQAGFDRFSQPQGSVSRVSNLVYTRRGALKVCDGSYLVSSPDTGLNAPDGSFGPITELFLFQPSGGYPTYFGIAKNAAYHLNPVTTVTLSATATGVLVGSYLYTVTAIDGVGGETEYQVLVTITVTTAATIRVTWSVVANAVGYNIYRTPAAADGDVADLVYLTTTQGTAVSGATGLLYYDDNNPDSSLGTTHPPTANTSQAVQFWQFPVGTYTESPDLISGFPADALPIMPTSPVGPGGGVGGVGGSGNSGGNQASPTGGLAGNTGPLPQIVQFTNLMCLALGNGVVPYTSDGTPANTKAIVNTFTATYPTWAPGTAFNQGDQIEAPTSDPTWVFTATQGGITNGTAGGTGTEPIWPETLNATVADGSVIWQNSGALVNTGPPAGAAHAEVYAGSLWVGNTSPMTTSDQLDGPSAIRMSDLNNPDSWNPLNSALIDPDDGDQCAGLKAFTIAEAGIAPENFLVFFKYFATYLVQGVFGSTNFAITRLQTDMGCVSPRTIQFIPGYGIMRLSHLGFAVTDGLNDKLQDPESIRPYLFPESTENDITSIDQSYLYFAKATQTVNPPMYVAAVPLLGNPSNLFIGVNVQEIATTLPTGTLPLPDGTYYLRIVAVFTNDQTVVSGQFSATLIRVIIPGMNLAQQNAIQVTLPFDNGVANWQIYMTTSGSSGPGQENGFIEVTNGTVSVTITGSTVFTPGTPPIQLGGQLTRLFCYDLVIKAWTVVDLPFPISVLYQARTPGIEPLTLMAGFWDGGIRRWQAGDVQWDAGAQNNSQSPNVQWNFRDAEVFTEGGTVRIFHNKIIIRGDGGPSQIQVTPQANGQLLETITAALTALGNGQYEARVPLMQTLENLNVTVSGSGACTVESVSDLVTEKPPSAALIFS